MADFATLLYGTAQNAEQTQGQGISTGLQEGIQDTQAAAQLAIQKQHLDLQQQQMQQQLQEVQTAKVEKLYDYLGKAQNFQNMGARNNYLKSAIGLRDTMGLSSTGIPDESIMALGSDENMGRYAALDMSVQNGQMSAADAARLATDPQLRDKFAQITPIPPEMQNKSPDLSAAQTDFLNRQQKQKEMQIQQNKADIEEQRLDLALKTAGNRQANVNNKEADTFADKQRAAFKPISDKDAAMGSALQARDRVQSALASDPSGKTIAPQDVGGMVFSLLHGELGRVNSSELANQFHMPGIENMAQDQLVKIFGGANPNTVKNLIQRVDTSAQELDTERNRISSSFTKQVNNKNLDDETKQKLLDPMTPYTKSVFYPSGTHNINGHQMTIGQMRQFADQHPDDPALTQMKPYLGGQ